MPRASNAELATKLRQVLDQLEAKLAHLTGTPSLTEEAALERWLQLAIQMCMDLGDRILAAAGVEEPPRAKDVFAALQRLGVLDADETRRMEELTRTRNELVHDYGDFTPESTPRVARQALPTLKRVAGILIGRLP